MSNPNIDTQITHLITNFKKVLDLHENHLKNFCNYGVQIEGWFKGEFLCFLDSQKKAGNINDFDREVKFREDQRKKVDFRVAFKVDGKVEYAWIELKHWLIGYQKGVMYNSNFYFSDPTSAGISQDIKKLSTISPGGKYMIILAPANPGGNEWQKGIEIFNRKFAPLKVDEVAQGVSYPESYYLGILKT